MGNIIEIKNLRKSFGTITAVNDISFCVGEGELFAFLGVNGAGKSTTISIMCNTVKKDSGDVLINGLDSSAHPEKIKRDIGVVFQSSVLDKVLTVRDNLQSRAALYGICGKDFEQRLSELCDLLDIGDLLERTVGKLSGGQRRRIDIARAIFHEPKILILDEPTTGLDPQTRQKLWSVIASLRKNKNVTVFLTTHYMEEAADADHIVIIDGGKIVAEGTPHELKNRFTRDFITIYGCSEEQIKLLNKEYQFNGNIARITVESTQEATALIVKFPEIFKDYEITKAKMDDVFLAATGKSLSSDDNFKKERGVK